MNLFAALLAAASFSVQVHGKGPAMILIPGLACSGDVWNGAVARYQNRYQLHVLTLAGFAGQPAIFGPLLATVRDDLAAYIRAQKLESLTPEQFSGQNRQAASSMVTSPADVERVASWGARSSASAVAQAMEELLSTDLRSSLARLQTPLLLIGAGAGSQLPEKELLARYLTQVSAAPRHQDAFLGER